MSGFGRRWTAVALVVGAGLVVASRPAPTGTAAVDVVLAVLGGAFVAWVGGLARRWSLLWLAAVATLVSSGVGFVLPLVALVLLAARAGARRGHRDGYGAMSAAFSAGALAYGEVPGPAPLAAALSAVAVLPVVLSARRRMGRRERRILTGGLAAAGVFAVGATVAAAAAGYQAAGRIDEGIELARSGIDHARDGDRDAAAADLSRAVALLDAAWGGSARLAALPARAVPVVGWHVKIADDTVLRSRDAALAAARVADQVDLEAMAPSGGGVDVAVVAEAAPLLRGLSRSLDDTVAAVDPSRTPWLLAPLAGRLEEVHDELDRVAGSADLAARTAELAPGLLGADRPRRWLVLLTTPAEARGFGGLVGSWAEVQADAGRLSLLRTGRAGDLNGELRRDPRLLLGVDEYVARYDQFLPELHFEDLTYSPDFPTDALVASQLFERAAGTRPDAVVLLDPTSMAAMLAVTGPVRIDGRDAPLGADDAEQFFLKDQYGTYGEETGREDALAATTRAVVERLAATRLPAPRALGELFGRAAREQHLGIWAPGDAEQRLFDDLGVSGRFVVPAGHDFLSVVAQNAANNKNDPYLVRTVTYTVDPDRVTGQVTGTVRVEIRNTTPTTGVPDAVTGSNDRGYPPGTSALYLSVYTALPVTGGRVDGTEVYLSKGRELGANVASVVPNVFIPAGETRVIEFDVAGELRSVAADGTYRVAVRPQMVAGVTRTEIDVAVMKRRNDDGVHFWSGSTPRVIEVPTVNGDGRTGGTAS